MDRIKKTVEELKETAQRQAEICAIRNSIIDQQIEELQNQKRRSTAAMRQYSLVAQLTDEGASAWVGLTNTNIWKKENILAVFCCKKEIPRQFREEFWRENAPDELVDDRDILIARASRGNEFARFYTRYHAATGGIPDFRMPDTLLGDAEVVAAVARSYPEVLLQVDLEQDIFDNDAVFQAFVTSAMVNVYHIQMHTALSRFSRRIRRNSVNMLQAARAGLNAPRCITGNLVHDKDFALKLAVQAKNIYVGALRRFSEPIKSDRDVVLAFVQRDGLCIKDASQNLRRDDLEVVCAASESDAASLQYCVNGPVKKKLGACKAFMLDAIRHTKMGGHPSLYGMLSPPLKMDLELIVASRNNNCLEVSDLPEVYSRDPQFWKASIAESCLFWQDLPEEFRRDIVFVRCIKGFGAKDWVLVRAIVEQFPALSEDVTFWSDSVLGEDSQLRREELRDLVRDLGRGVRHDRELMLRACQRSCELLGELPSDFRLDQEFVEAAIAADNYALAQFPFDSQLLYPELVAVAISNLALLADVKYHRDYVNPELWDNLVLAEAWFQSKGGVHDFIPARMKENRDYCLLVAEHSLPDTMEDFVCQRLKRDKSFIMEAIKRNGTAYVLAEGGLATDYDCTLSALGSEQVNDLIEYFKESENVQALAFFRAFLNNTVQEKLEAHDAFVKGLLCGMSEFSGPDCQLSLLQRGSETSLALTKRFAEFLGVPPDKELSLLHRAMTTLRMLPEPDEQQFLFRRPVWQS